MPDESVEDIGGISVSVGASHAQLVSDLARADQLLEAWAKQKFTVNIGATAALPAATARPVAPAGTSVTFGAQARAAAQAQAAQPAMIASINAALAKTGERYNAVTGEVESATAAVTRQKQVVVATQQAAAAPTALNIDTAALQNDLNQVLATMREIVATAKATAELPAPRVSAADRQATAGRAPRARVSGRDDAELQRLTAEQQAAREASAVQASATLAPPLTQARAAQQQREREDQAARTNSQRARALAGQSVLAEGRARTEAARTAGREEKLVRQATRADQARDEAVFAQTSISREAQRERQIEERIALQRASITAAGRTARTESSGLAALFGGTQGRLIEARARLSSADKTAVEAERAALPFRRRLAEYDEDIANSSGKVAAARIKAREAFVSDPKTVAALEREQKAIEGQGTALASLNKLQSGGNVARNLLAITAGGAAFSIGFQVVSRVVEEVAKGFNELFEVQTGFGGTSTRVTQALGQQTLALHGNVDAALAAAEAQAGLSAASADTLNQQLRLTTQIKAGAQAQQQASELFRAGFGVGNAPSGLFGSFGGVLGTGLFGQKGFTQQIQTDISAFTKPRNQFDILGNFSRGLDYATNPDVQTAVDRLAIKQGQRTPGQELLGRLGPIIPGGAALANASFQQAQQAPQAPFQQTQLSQEGVAYLNNLNDAAKRGAEALGDTATASFRVATSQQEVDDATKAAAAAGDQFGVTLAQQSGIVLAFGKDVAGAGKDAAAAGAEYKKAATQAAVGVGIADPAQLGRLNLANERQRQRESAASLDAIRARQQFELPSIIANIGRQQQFQANVQQPTQQFVGAIAAPNVPVGTGIAAQDRDRLAGSLKEAQGLQDQLNAEYEQGRQIVRQTYDPAVFKIGGQAAVDSFNQALATVESTGTKIAQIQAGISNEQAAYQAAQYNFQLQIAKRTLSDIGGLVGKNFGAGQSFLGVLERQNLELSRQAQQLQFILSQRQINFQKAVAGFSVPGVTPEERQANIKEAQIEAEFAQKQLDIQKQAFKNQVKIVDISNLRQGRDLLRQIGLLQEGRKVTLDTAAAEQKLLRLNQLQQREVAKVGTYLGAVDNLAAAAMSQIQQLEAAAGRAMAGVATDVLAQFGIFLTGLYAAVSGMSGPGQHEGAPYTGPGGYGGGHAAGGVYNLTRPTRIGDRDMAGEAGNETLLILSHPRAASGTAGGGNTFIVNINEPQVRKDGDVDEIARKVMQAMGRQASTLGLRSVG